MLEIAYLSILSCLVIECKRKKERKSMHFVYQKIAKFLILMPKMVGNSILAWNKFFIAKKRRTWNNDSCNFILFFKIVWLKTIIPVRTLILKRTVILVRTLIDAHWRWEDVEWTLSRHSRTLGKIGYATVMVTLPNPKNHCTFLSLFLNFVIQK